MFKNKMLKNIITLGGLVVLICTAAIVSLNLNQTYELQNYKANIRSESVMEKLKKNIDDRVIYAFSMIEQLRDDNDIWNYANAVNETAFDRLKARDKLVKLEHAYSQLGCSISLRAGESDYVITNKSTIEFAEYFKSINADAKTVGDCIEKLRNSYFDSDYTVFPYAVRGAADINEQILIILKYKGATRDEYFYITFDQTFLLSGINLTGNEIFLIALDNKPLLYKNGENFSSGAIKKEIDEIAGKISGGEINKYIKGKIVNNTASDVISDWSYTFIYTQKSFIDNLYAMLRIMLLFFLFFTLIGGVYVFFAYKKLYIPISNLVSNIKKYIDSDSYDEVDNIKQAFSNIRSANETLRANLSDTLTLYVKKGDTDKVKMLLDSIFKKNLKYESISNYEKMDIKFALVSIIKKVISDNNKSAADILGEKSSDVTELINIEDTDKFMSRVIDIFIKLTNSVNNVQHAEIFERILRYIEENYKKDISLTDVADFYGISSGYVSKMFRERKNDTFKDYLNKYRVEKAKEMILKNKTMKINDIGTAVGFLNATTFIRVFKRYENITPGEYKINNIT